MTDVSEMPHGGFKESGYDLARHHQGHLVGQVVVADLHREPQDVVERRAVDLCERAHAAQHRASDRIGSAVDLDAPLHEQAGQFARGLPPDGSATTSTRASGGSRPASRASTSSRLPTSGMLIGSSGPAGRRRRVGSSDRGPGRLRHVAFESGQRIDVARPASTVRPAT